MTKKELQDQIEFLKARIHFLESLHRASPNVISSQWSTDNCIDLSGHDYPNPWFATIPPHCKKCGKQAPSMQITCDTGIAVNK